MHRVVVACSLAASAFAATVATGHDPVATALPAGFADSLVASVERPTAVEYLADNRVVVLEQHTGRVRVIQTDTGELNPNPLLDLDVCTGDQQGLLGFTTDPERPRVFVFYTRPEGDGCVNTVRSYFTTSSGAIDTSSETVLLDNLPSPGNNNGGDLEIGNDGYLYVSVGDGVTDPRGPGFVGPDGENLAAADLAMLNGKILRIDRETGAPAPDNPYVADGNEPCSPDATLGAPGGTQCEEIYASGLRHPYRFAFDPNTGDTRFFVNDVGANAQEEIDLGAAGADYGWPTREGSCPRDEIPPCAEADPADGFTEPVLWYTRDRGSFITAGAFVPDGAWPEDFDGGYLFADGGAGTVWLRPGPGGPDDDVEVVTDRFGIADMTFVLEPDGWALYYTLNATGEVRKVTFTSSAPAAPSGPLAFERLPVAERAFDSRPSSPIRAGHTRLIDLGPSADGARAALVNLTYLPVAGASSFATAWEPRTPRPSTSNVNSRGAVVANAAIVPLDDDGRMLLYVSATSDVIVDVFGVFGAADGAVSSGRLQPVEPARLVDTRVASDAGNPYTRSLSGDGELVNVPVAGRAAIPDTGVDAVVLTVTATSDFPGPFTNRFVTVFDGGGEMPPTSNLNITEPGDIRVNTVVTPLGTDGSVDIFLFDVTDVIIDVVGWTTDETVSADTAGRFHVSEPTREVDTRLGLGFGPLADGESEVVNPAVVPDDASAVAQNLTIAFSDGWGFITASPTAPPPPVSNVNAVATGQTRAALAVTPLATDGSEVITGSSPFIPSGGGHQVLVDVFGWFE